MWLLTVFKHIVEALFITVKIFISDKNLVEVISIYISDRDVFSKHLYR